MGKFPRKVHKFMCRTCDTPHDSYDEAENCCSEVDELDMWECIECEELYEDKDDAYNCCG